MALAAALGSPSVEDSYQEWAPKSSEKEMEMESSDLSDLWTDLRLDAEMGALQWGHWWDL